MTKRPAFIVDVDGTLALRTDARPNPYDMETVGTDAPNEPIVELLATLQDRFEAKTIVVSAREQQYFMDANGNDTSTWHETGKWLDRHGIDWDDLLLRPHKDFRPDAEIKEELYRKCIEPYYEVLYVLDDRESVVRRWRELGLICLAVAEGRFL